MNKKIFKALFAPIGKGVLIFILFGFALYAYAAVTFPDSQPADVTGVMGLYVGKSDTLVTGAVGGYINANDECYTATDIEGSHVCTTSEMINSYNNNAVALSGESGYAWINNGASTVNVSGSIVSDCDGWTSTAPYGFIWSFGGVRSLTTACFHDLYFACCK